VSLVLVPEVLFLNTCLLPEVFEVVVDPPLVTKFRV